MAQSALAASPDATSCAALRDLKNQLQRLLPHVKSSHLTEAIACGLGFQTHAALHAAMDSGAFTANVRDALAILPLVRRLNALDPSARAAHCLREETAEHMTPSPEFEAHRTSLRTLEDAPNQLLMRHAPWGKHLFLRCAEMMSQRFDLGSFDLLQSREHKDPLRDTIWWAGVDHSQCLPGWGRCLDESYKCLSEDLHVDTHFFKQLPLPGGRYALYVSAVLVTFPAGMPEHMLHDAEWQARIWGWKATRVTQWKWSWQRASEGAEMMCLRRSQSHAEYVQQWEGSFKQWLWINRSRLRKGAGTSRRLVIDQLLRNRHLPLDIAGWDDFQQRFLSEYLRAPYVQLPSSTADICTSLLEQWQLSQR
ncbi:MAG: hypothetical protein ACI4QS_05220 [Comamonas sp.]